ncbi:hypothetical protein [Pseudonocardia yunnanensis]|uniref:Uncharacterized protein n=1 Tax=Pseudonocardia yunnanensis TaxID=58107 RepID=A0ABW4EUI0_9PSEU
MPTVDLPHLPFTPESRPIVDVVAIEEQHTERACISPDREPFEADRRVATLVGRYRDYL